MSTPPRSPVIPNYAIAVLSVAAALVADLAFDRLLGAEPSASLFLCAVMLVAWVGGTGPAMLAAMLAILAYAYLLLQPEHSFALPLKNVPRLALLAIATTLAVSLIGAQRRAAASLRRVSDAQQATVRELQELNETLRIENAERRQAEARASRAEQELQLTIDTMPVLAARYRSDGFMEFRNKNWRDYTGLSQDNLEGQRWGGALHPDDAAMVEREWRTHIVTGEPFELEQRLRRADGEYRWHWVRRVPLRNEMGEVIKWYGVAFDVDDRKRVENALRQSEAELAKARHELQLIIDTVPVLMLRHRADGVIDFVNQTGRSYSGIVSTNWTRRTSVITHPDDVSRLEEAWDVALATGEPFETEARLRRADGEYRWFATRRVPLHDRDGEVIAWYAATYDIEDRKRAEDALRRSEAALLEARRELQLIIDTIPALVVRHQADGIIDFVNETWRRYTGLSQAAWKGRGSVVVHPDDLARVEQTWLAHLKTGEAFETEQRLRNADGEYRWHFLRRVPLRNDSGDVIAWYGAAHDIEDRRSAENALRASEAQLAEARRELELTIDSIPVMVSTFEADGTRSFVNQTWQNYTGHTEREATGKGLNTSVYYHPDDVQTFDNAWRTSQAKGEMLSVDVRTRRADGRYRWYTMRRAPRRGENGNIVKWYSVGVDVEDQKVAENALRKSEAQLAIAERELRLTLDSIPTLAWRARADGFAEYINKRWLDYTGFSLAQALGWEWQNAIHPDDRAGLYDTWLKMLASGKPDDAEVRMRRFDGSYRWFLYRTEALRDESGAVVGWYGTNTDIEDRKRVESALQRSEAYSAEAQKLSQTGSFAWDVATRDYFWSDQAYQILGFDRSVKPSINLVIQRTHPEDRFIMERELDRSAQGAPYHDFEVRLLMPDGQIKHIHLLAHRITYQSGNEEIVGAVMDITEARKSQETLHAAQTALAHASRVATLGEISATIAHEVNQPLAAIVANGQACLRFLHREKPDLNDVRGAVEWIVKDGNRAGEVIRRVRGLLKKADTEKTPLDVNDLVNEVAALLRRELAAQQVTPQLELAPAVPPIVADRVQLQQVIINLVMNGAEAMQTITGRSLRLVIRTYQDEAHRVVVAVEDSGPGIAGENADRVFDPFFSTKPGGLGMGLSICRSIVEAHGGRLWSSANAGPGATFQFALPSHRESVT
jgi:PAS domain S-box-containing protein